jgi:hypothetical protein
MGRLAHPPPMEWIKVGVQACFRLRAGRPGYGKVSRGSEIGRFFHVAIDYRCAHGEGHGGSTGPGKAESVSKEQVASEPFQPRLHQCVLDPTRRRSQVVHVVSHIAALRGVESRSAQECVHAIGAGQVRSQTT